ncbi:signal peptide peptidase-like 4 [Populus alba x Populus x berolinensis]|nr:signal peptide peptidase-like 4 [Populus alba x Populus x berolinensis]
MNICKNICVFIVVLASSFCFGSASDIVHQDDIAPKRPGCENNFVLKNNEYVGVGARFGLTLESKEKHANLSTLALADPPDCCSKPRNKLSGEVILAHRGNCSFTAKANVAEDAGASAILIINNQTELFKMVCEVNETDVKIGIAAVMLPQDAGASLEKIFDEQLHSGAFICLHFHMFPSSVKVQLYSPRRPVVDVAEVFLWLMAVGTILCASYWSAWSAREAAIEQDKLLKDGSDEFIDMDGVRSSGIVNINTASAILFVVIASCFLVMLYKLMSYWFIEVLVVLFCIGGVEMVSTCWRIILLKFPSLELSHILTLCSVSLFLHSICCCFGPSVLPPCPPLLGLVKISLCGTVLLKFGAFLYDMLAEVGGGSVFVSKWWFQGECDDSDMIWLAKKNFLRAGYFVVFLITYAALNMMDGAWPASFALHCSIHPLGTFLTLGRQRGDLKTLWTMGEPERHCPHIQFQPPGSQ